MALITELPHTLVKEWNSGMFSKLTKQVDSGKCFPHEWHIPGWPQRAPVPGSVQQGEVNVVFHGCKTCCGAEEVQKYSSACFKFTNCYFLTFCFSVAKTITDGINTLKMLWNTWNPWEEGSGNFLHPWFWHWTPDSQQKLIALIWF